MSSRAASASSSPADKSISIPLLPSMSRAARTCLCHHAKHPFSSSAARSWPTRRCSAPACCAEWPSRSISAAPGSAMAGTGSARRWGRHGLAGLVERNAAQLTAAGGKVNLLRQAVPCRAARARRSTSPAASFDTRRHGENHAGAENGRLIDIHRRRRPATTASIPEDFHVDHRIWHLGDLHQPVDDGRTLRSGLHLGWERRRAGPDRADHGDRRRIPRGSPWTARASAPRRRPCALTLRLKLRGRPNAAASAFPMFSPAPPAIAFDTTASLPVAPSAVADGVVVALPQDRIGEFVISPRASASNASDT